MAANPALHVAKVLPAYQQVADQLRDLILDGSLGAGDRLPTEAELAATFGVSRSTVRESLRVLASQGLITTLRGSTGGTFVARVEQDHVRGFLETSLGLMSGSKQLTVAELLEAREMFEVPAARLAAVRRTPEHLVALRAAYERELASRGRSRKFTQHRNFHHVIAEAAGNRLVVMMSDPVFNVIQSHLLSPAAPEAFWRGIDADHLGLVEAIEAGDADLAAALMRDHLTRLRPAYDE